MSCGTRFCEEIMIDTIGPDGSYMCSDCKKSFKDYVGDEDLTENQFRFKLDEFRSLNYKPISNSDGTMSVEDFLDDN